jgi:hypothetical protein
MDLFLRPARLIELNKNLTLAFTASPRQRWQRCADGIPDHAGRKQKQYIKVTGIKQSSPPTRMVKLFILQVLHC